MSSKITVTPLITDHLKTLRHARSSSLRPRDVALHYMAPLATAVVAVRLGARLEDATQMIAGAGILAGFSFGLAIYVFQLRLDAARDPRVPKGDLLLDLLDELFANVSYSVLVGLTVVAATTTATAFSSHENGGLAWGWTLGITFLALHYILTMLMCLKRLRAAYRQSTI